MTPLLGLAQFAVGTASAVAGFQQQSQQAASQNAFYVQNARAANEAAVAAYSNQQIEMNQKLASADQDVMERRIQALKARGTARDAAGAAGVTGLSVDALINDYYGAEGRGVDSVVTNYDIERQNIISQMEATQHQTTARINSVQRVEPPSFLGAAIRIAGAGLSGYTYGSGRAPAFNPAVNNSLGIA